jgi:DedD protein
VKQSLKQRLIGAIVLVALAVIFLPMLLSGPVDRSQVSVPVEIPPKPRVQPSSQLPEPDDETATRPPPTSIAEAPAPVDEASADNGGGEPAAGTDEGDAPTGPDQGGEGRETVADGSGPGAGSGASGAGATGDPESVPEQGGWAVQVGGFRSRDNALGLRDKLRGEGYTVYVDQSEWKGKPLFRVRVGPVLGEDEAESLKARLENDPDLEGVVV